MDFFIADEYFKICVDYDINQVTETFAEDFYAILRDNHILVNEVYYNDEVYPAEQLIEIHKQCFSTAYVDKRECYHVLFSYSDFSQVLGGFGNRDDLYLRFVLLIPEADFWEYTDHGRRVFNARMKLLRNLFAKLWECQNSMVLVQTEWECSNVSPGFYGINKRCSPQTEPFSIISASKYCESWKLDSKRIKRDGMLLEDEYNWNFL